MKSRRNQVRPVRQTSGHGIAEFGPALGILLIAIFFPLVDMLSLGVSYGLCMVLNYNQVHEASLIDWNDATNPSGTVMKGIPDTWLNGMGRFTKISGYPNTKVTYRSGQTSAAGTSEGTGTDAVTDKIVNVTTTIVCNPFLPIPIPALPVPGLSGPMTFAVSSERTMENPDYAP